MPSLTHDSLFSLFFSFFLFLYKGLFAGFCSAVVTNPFDVARTRLQVDGALAIHEEGPKARIQYKYHGLIGCMKTMVRQEGLGVLAKGMVPRILYMAPISGLAFSVYELCKRVSYIPNGT